LRAQNERYARQINDCYLSWTQRRLLREVYRDAVLIFWGGKVTSVCHCDPGACPHSFNTDDVIGIDVGVAWCSLDEYKFGHGLSSGLNRIRANRSMHNARHMNGRVHRLFPPASPMRRESPLCGGQCNFTSIFKL
jgi:hypothetical protein